MTPEKVLEYIASKVGDASKAIYGIEYKEIDNPDPRLRDKPGQEKVRVPVEVWKTPGGQVIFEGYRNQSGTEYVPISQPPVKAETPAAGAVTATNTSTSYKWVEAPGGGRRLHVITKDKDGNQIADDEATPEQQRAYEVSEQRSRNPGGKSDAEIETEGKAAATKAEQEKKDTETKKNTWHEVGRDVVDNKQTGVAETIIHQENGLGEKRDVKGTSTTVKEPEKPTIREDPNNPGKWISIQSDPSQPGGVKITSVAGPDGIKPGQGPSLADLQVRYGTVVEDLQAYAAKLQDALAKGIITQADFDKRWQEAKAVASTKVNELNNLVTTQSSLYGQQAANWRQEQATANTRLNASSQALNLGVNAANQLKGASGSGQMGTIWSTLTAGRAAGEMYGGYASGPPPALPPAAASIMNMEINADGSITMRPKGGAAAGGAPGATGMPAAVGSIDDAVRADVTAAAPSSGNIPGGVPRMPGGGYAPANASISGGQARLPAVVDESGQPTRVPPSAMMQTLPPEILNEFDPEILAEAMAGMPEFGY